MTKAIFFDVANTLLYKPQLFEKMAEVLAFRGHTLDKNELAYKHKILSEAVDFPDKTNEHFYKSFNTQLLLSLGIEPVESLLSELFAKCSYLPWLPFQDTEALLTLNIPLGIISNWDNQLESTLKANFEVSFRWILGSQHLGLRKPDSRFFMKAIESTGFNAEEIMVVGDSVKLDIVPAARLGMGSVLVDRITLYPNSPFRRVKSLLDLERFI